MHHPSPSMTLTVQSHKEPFHSTGSGTEFFDKFEQANAKFERLNTNEINEKSFTTTI